MLGLAAYQHIMIFTKFNIAPEKLPSQLGIGK